MILSVIDIQVPAGAASAGSPVDVQVCLAIDGDKGTYTFTVKPFPIGTELHRLVQPDRRLYDRFRDHQVAISQVCQLVGQAVQDGAVHLPQRIAA